jgi:hypothetical protein
MADDEALNETPDDSIASALASAIAEHEAPKEGAGEAAPKAASAKPAVEASAEAESADGAKEPSKDAASEAEAEQQEGAGEAAETGEKSAAPDDAKVEAELTGKWSAADKEILKKATPEVRALIIRRHKEMETAYVKKTTEIAAFKRDYDPVDKYFEPFRDRMKTGGWTPAKLVEAWGNVEKRLMDGDGVSVVAGLVQGYKIDLGQVARALGLRPRPAANGSAAEHPEQPQADPLNISPDHPVMRQLSSIQERLAADDRARADQARRFQTDAESRVMGEIDQFKSALDDKGNPLHPHFDELEDVMTQLAQSAATAKKPIPPLKDLYETAVWANPSTREATLAARERAQQEKAAGEARAKAAQARKAGSSVSGAPGSGHAPNGRSRTDLSLRDQLEAAFGDQATGRV